MDANRTTIGELLGAPKKCYTVPPYQRGYAWETEQVEELWNDLEAADGGQHFLGSVVLQFPNSQEPQIIDGQQRLATLTILLCCIRDYYHELGKLDSMGVLHSYYVETHRPGHAGIFKLRLSEADNDFFQEHIQRKPDDTGRRDLGTRERPKKGSHRLLWNARNWLNERIGEELAGRMNTEEKLAFLDFMEEQVTEKIRLIQILVDDDDEAFQIFETLNDRGLSLSQADLLKNYLCMKWKLEKKEGNDIAKLVARWDEAIQPLSEKTDISVFLRHYLLSVVPEDKVRKEMIYKIFKKQAEQKKANEVVGTLAKHAQHYSLFVNPALCDDKPTARVLSNLETLHATQCYSMLLAGKETLNPEQFLRLARMAEVLTVRHSTICNRSARDLERQYHSCALKLRNNPADWETVIKDLAAFCPNDAVVKASFETMRHSRTTAFLLRRIEESAAAEERVLEPKLVHVEHIMPESLPPHWIEYLGIPNGEARAKGIKEATEALDMLGNLTLLGREYNIEAQNYSFERKKAEYYPQSQIQMTRRLMGVARWDLEAIKRRQKELAEFACKVWNPPDLVIGNAM